MPTLTRELRRTLETTVKTARREAEAGARKSLEHLAVQNPKSWESLTPDQRTLRRRLRAHAIQLGDRRDAQDKQEIGRLTAECAYEHWHRMLFARFLAELDLLVEPETGMAVTLDECRELARERGADWLELASSFATRMLPQIFRQDDPLLEIELPPETRAELEKALEALPRDTFLADDSLGWVYQFWQAERKDEVNRSGRKIGAEELPAVTQLFTEDYMVLFLLHNTLGAWWAGKVLAANTNLARTAKTEDELRAACKVGNINWKYLRFIKIPSPAGRGQGEGETKAPTRSEGATYHDIPPETLSFARQLRHQQTDAENLVWMLLRDRRLDGFKFRRQHPVPPYVLDFYCHEARLGIELDGGQHAADAEADKLRDASLAAQGIRVIRFWNNQVMQETEAVLEEIWKALQERRKPKTPSPCPPPAGVGGPKDRVRALPDNGTILPSPSGRGVGGEGVWRPAAGTFDGWPKTAREITLLDPCMGSGHFLVFAFFILIALRMTEEGLSETGAVEAVLRDNLYGLEIDPRCTQIAAFNLALAGWRKAGYRPLPRLHLACSGLSIGVSKTEWLKMAERAATAALVPPEHDLFGTKDNLFSSRIKEGFSRLYDLFEQAPVLGSLVDPRQMTGDLQAADFLQLEPLLAPMLTAGKSDEMAELAVAAQGMMKAAEVLRQRFTLVVTNVPYLGRGKQDKVLREYCETHHNDAKADLATCFVERCLDVCAEGGSTALVTPQNWLFLGTYKKLRKSLLERIAWDVVARLGPRAFETIGGEVVNVALLALTLPSPGGRGIKSEGEVLPSPTGRGVGGEGSLFTHHAVPADHTFMGIDVSDGRDPLAKAIALRQKLPVLVGQKGQLGNPDCVITLEDAISSELLGQYAKGLAGVLNGDTARFEVVFWEVNDFRERWEFEQSTVLMTNPYSGRQKVLLWEQGSGQLRRFAAEVRERLHDADKRGNEAWGKQGVVISQMGALPATIYTGEKFDTNAAVILPKDQAHVAALWSFCCSEEFRTSVRRVSQKINVTNATLVKVPFDLAHWQRIAAEKYPNGLPKPHSIDPTQWLFNGHPKGALTRPSGPPSPGGRGQGEGVSASLQVAVARLLGYRWPRQTGSSFPDCPALGPDGLESLVDPDGIVPLTPLRGEAPAADRLIALLAVAYGSEWSAAKLASLLADAGFSGLSLDDWLRDNFFAEHCDLFHQRPFVWHVWDGRRDGFQAFVNYHRLAGPNGEGKRVLETLLYAYLGDWIDRQRADQRASVEGADGRLAAAEHLKGELEKIHTGEPPYDIFVRWKPLHEQSIGWEPDINDGVRLNIRPFMTARPLNARSRGACILRTTPRIKWDKDRGKEPNRPREDYPWFWSCDGSSTNFPGGKDFDGNRWNDPHYSRIIKEAARERHLRKT